MKKSILNPIENIQNAGTAREWADCARFGIIRTKHDSVPYDKGSDIELGSRGISVKASGFTLMSGSLCKGLNSFEEIWNRYAERVHSNEFHYVTNNWECYEMSLDEFKEFVFKFARTERESSKNGGTLKIRCRKETAEMREWLKART